MLEIELKVRVPSLDPVRAALEREHARFIGRTREHDRYYTAPHRDFSATDEALRVRYAGGNAILTYKGAKIRDLGLKAREELNTGITSGEVFEQILGRLGFVRTADVNKWRETYALGPVRVMLDEVESLGTFVEIEVCTGDDQDAALAAIDRLRKKLGVPGEAILSSYLELLLAKP